MDCYIGSVVLWAGSYIPQGWAACNGQLLPIMQNQAVFSLLGITYGGNGIDNFALPNLPQVADTDGRGSSKYIICLQGIYPTPA